MDFERRNRLGRDSPGINAPTGRGRSRLGSERYRAATVRESVPLKIFRNKESQWLALLFDDISNGFSDVLILP